MGLPEPSSERQRESYTRAMTASHGLCYDVRMEPEWTDAKFKVIRQPKRRWRAWVDWRVVAIIAALAVASAKISAPGADPSDPLGMLGKHQLPSVP